MYERTDPYDPWSAEERTDSSEMREEHERISPLEICEYLRAAEGRAALLIFIKIKLTGIRNWWLPLHTQGLLYA